MSATAPETGGPGRASVLIEVDAKHIDVPAGMLLIEAAERAGIYIPRFCYHPRMKPVGMCRMCLVELSGPRGYSLQPACFIPVAEGQQVITASAKVRKAQEGILEELLINHPLDCPVCDKGGECPLQDQTRLHGPGESRFIEGKRHWAKPTELSPLVLLDRERCIQCARCTRFADEVAGDAQIDFVARGDRVEVAIFPGQPFSSYFSGNTVQICPVGALTAPPYRFKSRPWDLEQVETTCTSCAVGCRVVAQSSAGALVRYLGIDSEPVNQSWLCDKGRYLFEAVHAPSRLRVPLVRRDSEFVEVRWHDALSEVAKAIRDALVTSGPESIGVLGGARLTNEDAYAWAKLAKGVIGTDSVDAQLGDGLPAEVVLELPRATIEEATRARLVLLLAPDLREELPVLFLRLRDAMVHRDLVVLECSPVSTGLSAHVRQRLSYLPGETAQLAAALTQGAGPVEIPGVDPGELSCAQQLVAAVADDATASRGNRGDGIVVILGRPSLAESSDVLAAAAVILHDALPGARFLSALRRANVHGALDMGLAPGYLPGRVGLEDGRQWLARVWEHLPETRGRDARGMLEAAATGELQVLLLLGADPLADFPDRSLARQALERVPMLVAFGTHPDASNELADIILPLAGDAERSGTTTNLEGRVTRLAEKVVPPGIAWPAWAVASELARHLGCDLGIGSLDELSEEIARVAPTHRAVTLDVLGRPAHRDGIVVGRHEVAAGIDADSLPIPRPIDPMATPGINSVETQGAPLKVGSTERCPPHPMYTMSRDVAASPNETVLPHPHVLPIAPHLDEGAYRLVVSRHLYDQGTLVLASASLSPLVAGAVLAVHPAELARLGLAEGQQLRAASGRAELVVDVAADATLDRHVVVLGANLDPNGTNDALELIDASAVVNDVRLTAL